MLRQCPKFFCSHIQCGQCKWFVWSKYARARLVELAKIPLRLSMPSLAIDCCREISQRPQGTGMFCAQRPFACLKELSAELLGFVSPALLSNCQCEISETIQGVWVVCPEYATARLV